MIPCHVCGKDASIGWVKGFIPAPDSQKLALCAEHDTEENRRGLAAAWSLLLNREIRNAARLAAYKATHSHGPGLQTLTIHFNAGGLLSLSCLNAELTDHERLKVRNPDGSLSFFPLRQIRRYDLAMLPFEEEQ